MFQIKIKTSTREQGIDITSQIKQLVQKTGVKEGICFLYCPHATAAVTVAESYDPNVLKDITNCLNKLIPKGKWLHDRIDNNGDAHIKAAIIGPSLAIPIQNKKLALGTWQNIILLEFDGPRERTILCKIQGE